MKIRYLRAITQYEGRPTLVYPILSPRSPNKIRVYKCALENGNRVARHESRLEFLPDDEIQAEASAEASDGQG